MEEDLMVLFFRIEGRTDPFHDDARAVKDSIGNGSQGARRSGGNTPGRGSGRTP